MEHGQPSSYQPYSQNQFQRSNLFKNTPSEQIKQLTQITTSAPVLRIQSKSNKSEFLNWIRIQIPPTNKTVKVFHVKKLQKYYILNL